MSVLDIAMVVADAIMAAIPRPEPERAALERCRIISHRGEFDNKRVMENTLPAFRAARDAGVWGIECDLRWTADQVPVICHDPDPGRVFGLDTPVSDLDFGALRRACPLLPSLAEVLDEFGGRTHLMLELKTASWPQAASRAQQLRDMLAPFRPAEDYHLLSLDPAVFERVDFAPPACLLPVAELNFKSLSRVALERGYAGLGGHYLLLGAGLKRRHDAAGQRLGIGFPNSANCLRRELNRGIEWIFSNDAVKLQSILDGLLAQVRD